MIPSLPSLYPDEQSTNETDKDIGEDLPLRGDFLAPLTLAGESERIRGNSYRIGKARVADHTRID